MKLSLITFVVAACFVGASAKDAVIGGKSLEEDAIYWSRLLDETEMSAGPTPRPPSVSPPAAPTEAPPTVSLTMDDAKHHSTCLASHLIHFLPIGRATKCCCSAHSTSSSHRRWCCSAHATSSSDRQRWPWREFLS